MGLRVVNRLAAELSLISSVITFLWCFYALIVFKPFDSDNIVVITKYWNWNMEMGKPEVDNQKFYQKVFRNIIEPIVWCELGLVALCMLFRILAGFFLYEATTQDMCATDRLNILEISCYRFVLISLTLELTILFILFCFGVTYVLLILTGYYLLIFGPIFVIWDIFVLILVHIYTKGIRNSNVEHSNECLSIKICLPY